MSLSRPKIGFIGVGTIAEALITGLYLDRKQRIDILLSPRNREIATRLASKYELATVAGDNQAVLDGSDIVVIAVTPQVAESVLEPLRFRSDHKILSLVATYPIARLRSLVAPATEIGRATPLPPIAKRRGAIALFPTDPEFVALLDGLGMLLTVDNEGQIDSLWAVTGMMGAYFGLLDEMSLWLTSKGLPAADTRTYLGAVFHALATSGLEAGQTDFARLAKQHSTPGGLNEQAHRELSKAGWKELVSDTLNLLEKRILGNATLADCLSGNPPENEAPPPRGERADQEQGH